MTQCKDEVRMVLGMLETEFCPHMAVHSFLSHQGERNEYF